MLGILFKKMSLWWRFKQLDRTYQPLLEKAMAFENQEALIKLEEQYWSQTACLLEERLELRKAQGSRIQSPPVESTPPIET
jgi:hypothetical protein